VCNDYPRVGIRRVLFLNEHPDPGSQVHRRQGEGRQILDGVAIPLVGKAGHGNCGAVGK
jgi:hypothetical protein